MRRELESRDSLGGGPYDPRDRDPMEIPNLLAEKRKDLRALRRSGEGLDRIAAAQRRAEAAQNALSPEIEERLRKGKHRVEQQKRLNVKLHAEWLRTRSTQKKAEEEVRAVVVELRNKTAQLQRPQPGSPGEGGESRVLRQLRRDADILREAVRQDERKLRALAREDEGAAVFGRKQNASLRQKISEQEEELDRLKAELHSRPELGERMDAQRADELADRGIDACDEAVSGEGAMPFPMPSDDVVARLVAEWCDDKAEVTWQSSDLAVGTFVEVEPEPEAAAANSPPLAAAAAAACTAAGAASSAAPSGASSVATPALATAAVAEPSALVASATSVEPR